MRLVENSLIIILFLGFREGRRASDGLLLLADGKLGEHLKKLSRTNQFPPISQVSYCLTFSDLRLMILSDFLFRASI